MTTKKHNFSVEYKNDSGYSLLAVAIRNKHLDVAKHLIYHLKADTESTNNIG